MLGQRQDLGDAPSKVVNGVYPQPDRTQTQFNGSEQDVLRGCAAILHPKFFGSRVFEEGGVPAHHNSRGGIEIGKHQ